MNEISKTINLILNKFKIFKLNLIKFKFDFT